MSKTLRLLFPQWQGGNNPPYHFGARLLEWLAPKSPNAVSLEVPVAEFDGQALPVENGTVGQTALLAQLQAATDIINQQQPEKIITFGGDCLVSQAPFAYLNEKYENLGVLWIDSHPDISTPAMWKHAHAGVLGNLLGEGNPAFSAKVAKPIKPQNVLYVGLQKGSPEEEAMIERLQIARTDLAKAKQSSDEILAWLKANNIQQLAIHFDLDVLDPTAFRSLLFAEPEKPLFPAPSGSMRFEEIGRLVRDVAKSTDIVGFTFAEHLPWDDYHLSQFMADLPIFE